MSVRSSWIIVDEEFTEKCEETGHIIKLKTSTVCFIFLDVRSTFPDIIIGYIYSFRIYGYWSYDLEFEARTSWLKIDFKPPENDDDTYITWENPDASADTRTWPCYMYAINSYLLDRR